MKAFFKSAAQWTLFSLLTVVMIVIAVVLGVMENLESVGRFIQKRRRLTGVN